MFDCYMIALGSLSMGVIIGIFACLLAANEKR